MNTSSAATGITGAAEQVIIGSQALLGQSPQAPAELLVSIEADVFSLRDPADSDLIDGAFKEFVLDQLGALPELRTIVTFMSQTFYFGLKCDAII